MYIILIVFLVPIPKFITNLKKFQSQEKFTLKTFQFPASMKLL